MNRLLPIAAGVLSSILLGVGLGTSLRPSARAQDVNQSIAATGSAMPPLPQYLVRYPVPRYADDPGAEDAFSFGPDRLYTYHGGAWGWSPRFSLPARPQPTPTP